MLPSSFTTNPTGPPASPQRVSSAMAEIVANLARTRAQRAGLDGQRQEEAAQKAIAEWQARRAVYLKPSQHPGRGNGIVTNGHFGGQKLPSPEGIR